VEICVPTQLHPCQSCHTVRSPKKPWWQYRHHDSTTHPYTLPLLYTTQLSRGSPAHCRCCAYPWRCQLAARNSINIVFGLLAPLSVVHTRQAAHPAPPTTSHPSNPTHDTAEQRKARSSGTVRPKPTVFTPTPSGPPRSCCQTALLAVNDRNIVTHTHTHTHTHPTPPPPTHTQRWLACFTAAARLHTLPP
jgi:hypothetical protein